MKRPDPTGARPPAQPAPPPAPADAQPQPAIEIELKLAVPREQLPAVRRLLAERGARPPVNITSVYFDTSDRRLAAARAALRIRRVGEGPQAQWVQTLKTGDHPGALTRRGEWDAQVPGPRPRLARLADSPLKRLLNERAPRLGAVFRTQFERTVCEVRYLGARIEVALDEGVISAGRRSEAVCELELELREGLPSAVFELALELVGRGRQALALRPAIESKAARGYRLAQRRGPQPAMADAEGFATLLVPHRTHLEAARRIVGHGVHRVLANVEGAIRGEDPEYVHQARVALRRTRSALRVLGVAKAADDPVARDLRWLADCFGAARDWDVLIGQSLPSLRKHAARGDQAQWDRLLARANAQRHRHQLRLRAFLDSARFARAALRLLQWAEAPAAPTAARLEGAVGLAIDRGYQRLMEAGRDLSGLSPKRRHRLRILAKRQRYALELASSLMPGGAPARALKLLSRLQQLLGEVNDVHVAVQMLPSLTRSVALAQSARRWSERVARRNLPKAQARLDRLRRIRRRGAA